MTTPDPQKSLRRTLTSPGSIILWVVFLVGMIMFVAFILLPDDVPPGLGNDFGPDSLQGQQGREWAEGYLQAAEDQASKDSALTSLYGACVLASHEVAAVSGEQSGFTWLGGCLDLARDLTDEQDPTSTTP
jgi:hypothetical protein